MTTARLVLALCIFAAVLHTAHGYGSTIQCGVDGIICPKPEDLIDPTPDGKRCDKATGKSTWTNMFGYKAYDGSPYDGRCSFFGGTPALVEGLGWFIVVGTGGIFSLCVSFFMWLSERAVPSRHKSELKTSEHFSSAGRTITAGLTAADIVSKWTWAATLLQSSNVAYKFGISGPFWYAAGATIQVLLFAVLAVEIKRKCPAIHTVLEIVLARWGTAAHLVFLFFCLLTNLIVTAMLILGGASVVNALTGVNIYAAAFLIPVSVVFYTAEGGLMATFLSSWGHVGVIYIALLIFIWKVYAGPSELGSTDKVWENLMSAAIKYPVTDNYNGTYLTMWSTGGIVFGIINIIGNFGTVFVDQAYWQGAIAARPSATYKGYLLGGIAWFAIPFSMATTLGLAGRALDLPITIDESNAGLVPPAVAVHLLGPGGAFLITFQVFMAVTSTGSAEQIAVASLFAYDVWKRYVRKNVSGKEMILVSRIAIASWGVISGCLAIILFELKISLGWVYLAMGNFIGSAVFPIAFAITWRDCSAAGAIAGAVGGLAAAMTGWLALAGSDHIGKGVISVATLGDDFAMLCGNVVALFVSPLICVTVSLIRPQRYNWDDLNKTTESYLIEEDRHAHKEQGDASESEEAMNVALKWTYITGGILTFILIFAWPLLTLPQQNFTKSYWGWWVAIAFIWGHVAAAVTVVLPIWEARNFILHLCGCRKQDFSVTVRGREGYDPTGPDAYPIEKTEAEKEDTDKKQAEMKAMGTSPAPDPSMSYMYSAPHMYPGPMMAGPGPYGMPGYPSMMYPGMPGGVPGAYPVGMSGFSPMPPGPHFGSYP